MKPQIKKILQKFSTEKVELARKAPSVEKDLQKLDDKLRKAAKKMDASFVSYKKNWWNFIGIIKEIKAERKNLEGDIKEIEQSAKELGVEFKDKYNKLTIKIL